MLAKNVVAIVSGGASGLGAGAVSSLIRKGARVVVADLPHQHEEFLRVAATSPSTTRDSESGKVICYSETDVTQEDQVNRALDMAEEQFGEPVNCVVNCAGIAAAQKTISKTKDGSIQIHPLHEFTKTIQVNTVGTFNVARLAAARMINGGCIINTASVAAFDGQRGQIAYAASKGAVVGMTLPMARELAPFQIRVMTIAPGLFRTPLLEGLPATVQQDLANLVPYPSRLGDPEEYGQLVMSVLENPMLNGEVIRLDGALRMPP